MQLHPESFTAEVPESPANGSEALVHAPRPSRLKRRLLWSAAITGLILLLIFVPPLINANRYRLRIAQSMSASLGRPVHLDNVTLHLLPFPGLTLSNLVVSEDPAFGDEPTIRADSVEGTLRLSSLWRGHLEFSSVRFIEPHVNLVRNAEGRWNLADVLLHASHLDTAPTAQRHAGPTPRFPYIEATGGRVNLKLGEEKLPFAITDADFALWLPSPQVWRVRLTGQPARTDMNVTDPGILRIEGDLQRAATASDVPVKLRATWHDAPMGQASQILTDEDLGWRGTLNVDASLVGTLGTARLGTKLTLDDLRRSDFAAAHPLDLQVTCGAGLSATTVTLDGLLCTMPDDGPTPMSLQAAALNLQRPQQAQASVTAAAIPVRWALLWAALFSARVPTDLHPAGTVSFTFNHLAQPLTPTPQPKSGRHGRNTRPALASTAAAGSAAPWNQWTGALQIALPAVPSSSQPATPQPGDPLPVQLVWRTGPPAVAMPLPQGNGPLLHLQPVSVRLAPDATVLVNATLSQAGYALTVAGSASAAALLLPARYLPQLGDGLDNILPYPPTGLAPVRVDFSCTHPWGAAQTCTSLRPAPPGAKGVPLTVVPQPQQPGRSAPLLAPRSLSPYDQPPQPDITAQPQSTQPASPRF